MIKINRSKAESITIERLRVERSERFPILDLEYIRALERGDETSAIVAEKESLRTVTEKDFSNLSLEQLSELTLDGALAL